MNDVQAALAILAIIVAAFVIISIFGMFDQIRQREAFEIMEAWRVMDLDKKDRTAEDQEWLAGFYTRLRRKKARRFRQKHLVEKVLRYIREDQEL